MFDTLKLYSKVFHIGTKARLSVQSIYDKNITEKSLLYTQYDETTKRTTPIFGDMAFLNDSENGIYFSVKSFFTGNIAVLQFSIPRVLYKKNYIDYQFEDFNLLKNTIDSWLKKNDIEFDLDTALISRIDCTFNCQTDEDINNYFDIFKMIAFSRLQKFDYGSTFLFRNTRRQITVYDKRAEFLALHAPVKKAEKNDYIAEMFPDLPDNLLRFEYRLLRAAMIEKNFKDLSEENIIENYQDALTEFYNLVDNKKNFEGYQDDNVLNLLNDYSEMDGRKFFDKFLKDYALYKIAETCDINQVLIMLDRFDLKPYQKSRFKKMILDGAKLRFNKKDIYKYVGELKYKIENKIIETEELLR